MPDGDPPIGDDRPPAASSPGLVAGKVTKAHGLRGEVTVLVLSEVPERFEPGCW
jgi:ribosomal 30S subunit maturation factor RimM